MSLSTEQSDEMRAVIDERLRTLEEEISRKLGDSASQAPTFDRIGDDGDIAQVSQNSELDRSEAARDIDEWRDLQKALSRFEQGNYGMCIDCGIDIPYERLKAQPSALRCIDCQEIAERTVGPDPTPSI